MRVRTVDVLSSEPMEGLVTPEEFDVYEGPIFWIECYGCSGLTHMPHGPKKLPDGWVAMVPRGGDFVIEVYASAECMRTAADILAQETCAEEILTSSKPNIDMEQE